jgi:RNA polymerase sigma-70 factor, ECF subfamily
MSRLRRRTHVPYACETDARQAGRAGRGKKLGAPVANYVRMPLSVTQEASVAIPLAYARARMTGTLGQAEGARGDDTAAWLSALRGAAAPREEAIAALHALLLRGARHELGRRRQSLTHVSRDEQDDLAMQAADDALVAILAKLDTFRGESRFTTWAYKFVLLEAGVRARRRAWHGREVALDADDWLAARDRGPSAQQIVERSELLDAIRDAIRGALTPHQREVFSALALNGVPIDVLAERLSTTRGALYKTLHDARRKLRGALAEGGFAIETTRALGGGSDD